MKLNKIYTAVLFSTLPASTLFAAGLDRSGQSISAFLQPGNYAEAGLSVIDADVGSSKLGVDDMADTYHHVNAAVKVQATDNISLGLIYDQPFGANSTYDSVGFFAQNGEGTSVKVKTNNITALIGYQPTENWNIYAGPVWQTVEAKIALRGQAYKQLSGYDITVHEKEAYGWLAGAAFQIPEIALKASVTYRSEINHKADTNETFAFGNALGNMAIVAIGGDYKPYKEYKTQAVTPQSVNLDLQTGVAANTIAFANIRWVHWGQFAVTPYYLKAVSGNNLIDYSDDQWSANVGVGRKFNDKWSGTAMINYDSGAGNPVTTLGPTEGYWGIGIGGQYSPADNYFIQAGIRYMWLGDATAKAGANVLDDFTDNHAIGYGMKIGYRF